MVELVFDIECDDLDEFEDWLFDNQLGTLGNRVDPVGSKYRIRVTVPNRDQELPLVLSCPWALNPVP